MTENKKKLPVNVRLRPSERDKVDEAVSTLSGTRSEMLREAIYLFTRLWKTYRTECDKRDVEPDFADFGVFLRSADSDPDTVFD